VRYIDALANQSFIGYKDGFVKSYGTVLEFTNQKLTYSGRYDRKYESSG